MRYLSNRLLISRGCRRPPRSVTHSAGFSASPNLLIPEVVEVDGLSGSNDLLVRVVASDSDDLYRVAGKVLALPDVKRTKTSLAMHSLVPYRIAPLLQRLAGVATE